jgi:hypothetical protein
MRIGSAERRLNTWLWVLAVFVDVAVAAIVAYFLAAPGERLSSTFFVWLAIEVVSIAFVLLGVIRLFVIQAVGGFKPAKNGFLTVLKTNDFPAPGPYVDSVDYYLNTIAENEDEITKTRVAAAVLFGVREGVKANGGFVKNMMINSAHEEALKEYASRLPR